MKKENLTVYWAPAYYNENKTDEDWNILYPEPIKLIDTLKENKNKEAKSNSILYCPSFRDITKNTYIFKNSMEADIEYIEKEKSIKSNIDNFIGFSIRRPPSIEGNLIISYNLVWVFFCEESLEAEFTAPYFTKYSYMSSGSFVPGKLNINSWFRPINVDIQLWNNEKNLKIEKNDPLFYVNFKTEKNVVLKRFIMNDALHNISKSCVNYKNNFGPFKPLSFMYEDFKNSRNASIVIKNIKENLL